MKKTVAILLSLLMILSSITCLFSINASAEQTNLIKDGDFAAADLDADTATNWVVSGTSYTLDFEEGATETLPEGEAFNTVTFNRDSSVESGTTYIYSRYSVRLERNTDYKISFWVKNNGVKSFKYYMYEPFYINLNGSYKTYALPSEGQNIYSYDYNNGSTRVSRMDVNHIIKDATNNEELRNKPSSMASFSNVLIAPNNQGEWVKIEHTFTTGNDEYHEANIRLAFSVDAITDNTADKTLSIGGIEMTATPTNAIIATAEANDYDLGTVEPCCGAAVDADGDVTFTAVPLGSNKFLGWYKGGKLVSTNTTLTYAYNTDDTEKYKAMFEAYGTDVSDGGEKYANGTKVVTYVKADGSYDNSLSNGDWALASTGALTFQTVSATTNKARSGSKSYYLGSRYSYAGRNFTGLEKNTDYTLTFYSYMEVDHADTAEVNRRFERVYILPKDLVPAWPASDGVAMGSISTTDSRVIANYGTAYGTGRWEKIEIPFNTGDNTDVTLWLNFVATTITGKNTDGCYIDDISLVCNAVEEDDGEEEEDTTMDFEDITKWGKGGNGSKQIEGYDGYKSPETYVTVKENTNATYIKEGEKSIKLNTQTRWFDYKLEGLKANTKYALKFSYATNEMKASTGGAQTIILPNYGIFNYAAEGAKLGGIYSKAAANGFLHYVGQYASIMDADGVGAPDTFSYSVRRITDDTGSQGIAEVANVWYNTVLHFDSGSVSDTLAFVVYGNCAITYLDDIQLVEIKDDTKSQEYYAPSVEGKTATGSYDTDTATTTLYKSCTEEDYGGYLEALAAANFAEYATNAYGDNKFATYIKGNTTVNVTYNPYNSTMLISEQVTDTLPQNEELNTYTDKGLQPLIIQLDHNGATGGGIGMSYIIRLADGSFIIVDGGHTETYFDNANRLYKLLREYTPEGEIQIAAWLLTHCHSDHISGFMSFLERYGAQVNVEQVIYNFATLEQYEITGDDVGKLGYTSFELMKTYIEILSNAKVSTCHSGYRYHIRNAVIDIMFTLEDIFPSVLGTDYTDINNTSTTFKISFTDENVDQTLLITGDSANTQCNAMLKKYAGTELKSTFVQAIHHGIYYGYYELYDKMNPEVVLFPASANRLMNVLYQNQNSYFVKEDSVKEVVCSDYGTRVFALPYTAPEGLTGMSKFTLPAELDVVANPINTYVGASIRKADENQSQAIRFKFQIPEHIINAHTEDGYEVVEYGMMVSENSANLNYYKGNKAFVKNENGNKVFKGVAYDKEQGKKVVYDYVSYQNATEDYLRSTQYTCALYNIGVDKYGKTDYSKYDTTYYV
ncbi:MAG: MBL fold metallo-hydrolase, partial [Ruminococcaceae bacterium]|nr:MBL fold metallo-hydrolase [Oscillospiraceae bacterium]